MGLVILEGSYASRPLPYAAECSFGSMITAAAAMMSMVVIVTAVAMAMVVAVAVAMTMVQFEGALLERFELLFREQRLGIGRVVHVSGGLYALRALQKQLHLLFGVLSLTGGEVHLLFSIWKLTLTANAIRRFRTR